MIIYMFKNYIISDSKYNSNIDMSLAIIILLIEK